MIPEREREALMRLTMCAREECVMCEYKENCNFDFQYELATKNMNILADALRADRKTEPSGYNLSPVEDETQTYITEDRDTQVLDAWQVHHRNTTSAVDEPQTESMSREEDEPKCHKPQSSYYRCFCEEKEEQSYCDGCEFWYADSEVL